MLSHLDLFNFTNIIFRKFNKITKPHLYDVKFAADFKDVLEMLMFCLVSRIQAF